jgi:hypothetical protein
MPITAERVTTIINYAVECAENAKQMKRVLKQIEEDAKELLYTPDLPESVLDRIATIRSQAEDAFRFEVDQESLQNLFYEKAKFEINAKKNTSAATRMRILRAGYRVIGVRGRETTTRIDVEQQMHDDLEEMHRTGLERHPDQGPCNMDLDGQCTHCHELTLVEQETKSMLSPEQELARQTAPVDHPTTITADFETWHQLKHAARSEQIPTQDDAESWLPKSKDTLP